MEKDVKEEMRVRGNKRRSGVVAYVAARPRNFSDRCMIRLHSPLPSSGRLGGAGPPHATASDTAIRWTTPSAPSCTQNPPDCN